MPPFAKYLIFSQHRPHCSSSLLQAFIDPWLAITLSHTTLDLIMGNFNISKDSPTSPLSSHFLFLYSSELIFHPLTQSFPCACSVAQLCLTLCIPVDVALQTPLPMEFFRKEYWSRLPFPAPWDLLNPVPPEKPSHSHGHVLRLYSLQ